MAGQLTITDLDDFLTPSQACIIPIRGTGEKKDDGTTEIHIDENNNYYEVSTYPTAASGDSKAGSSKALAKAEINLNDCLACSGCITSTESMLITLQSQNEVLDFIAKAQPHQCSCSHDTSCNDKHEKEQDTHSHAPPRTPVLSISPQTLASLSAYYAAKTGRGQVELRTLLRRIRAFLGRKDKGAWRVWDTTFARHVSLRETVVEFEERKAHAAKNGTANGHANSRVPPPGPLPMLASACPGWVCYAEKAQGDLLPLLGATRSAQGIMGMLVKTWFATKMDISPERIYHVTAMPCYDKKLEASRSDFYSEMYATKDVDCVLTTGELDLLLEDLGFDYSVPVPGEELDTSRDVREIGSAPWPEMIDHPGSSSGSYLATIISSISAKHPNPTNLNTREIRGSTDNVEYILQDSITHEIIFKGAKCYGFRNLQNLVRKVGKETGIGKAGRGGASKLSAAIAARRRKAKLASAATSGATTPGTGETATPAEGDLEGGVNLAAARDEKKLDFVEVMACPGGCVNGGGQMKPVAQSAVHVNANATGNGDGEAMEVDEEGYPRPMPDDGVARPSGLPPAAGGAEEGMRWSTKEWVATVEAVYWGGLPTPPPSPLLRPTDTDTLEGYVNDVAGGPNGKRHAPTDGIAEINGNGNGVSTTRAKSIDQTLSEADEFAARIVEQVSNGDPAVQWESLRTRFRKVEGDILQGGGITHDAVKW